MNARKLDERARGDAVDDDAQHGIEGVDDGIGGILAALGRCDRLVDRERRLPRHGVLVMEPRRDLGAREVRRGADFLEGCQLDVQRRTDPAEDRHDAALCEERTLQAALQIAIRKLGPSALGVVAGLSL